MEYLGSIEAHPDDPPLTRDAWLTLIAARPALVRHPSRTVRNPATGKLVEASPPPDAVRLIAENEEIGAFSWGPQEYSLVNVQAHEGFRENVKAAAIEYARALGGRFIEFTDEE
jgi:hypothetical protein